MRDAVDMVEAFERVTRDILEVGNVRAVDLISPLELQNVKAKPSQPPAAQNAWCLEKRTYNGSRCAAGARAPRKWSRNYRNSRSKVVQGSDRSGWELGRARGLGRACAVAQGGGAHRSAAAIASENPKAWGAERERSASTHAMMQNGNQCM
eukprot:6212776-Pleurochrysis_carterae.AAC.5